MNTGIASPKAVMPYNPVNRYIPAAETAANIVQQVLGSLRGTDPELISQWVLTETREGDAWLFAVVDDLRVQSYQPWSNAIHALSTSLRGRSVFVSNTTGFRYAVLLSDRPALPKEIPFPGIRNGAAQIGMRSNGRPLTLAWNNLGHVLVAGMTQFGKSNFLRLLTLQARAEGYRFLLADLDGRTFAQMKNDPSLMLPIANTREGFEQVVDAALAELAKRARLFDEAKGIVDNLADYNAQVDPKPPSPALPPFGRTQMGEGGRLPPIMLMLDEFSSVILGMGGPKSKFAEKATELAWRGLKFGIQLVIAGQDFTKEIVGPVREQMRTRLCFRVARPDTSSVVIGRRGAENIRVPGRAMMPSGLVQTYLVAKDALGGMGGYAEGGHVGPPQPGPRMSEAEAARINQLVERFGGRADLEGIQEVYGMNERAARRIREDWAARGLIEKRGEANNAWFFVQTPWASKAVQTASERPNGVQAAENKADTQVRHDDGEGNAEADG